MLNAEHLRVEIVRPTLREIGLWTIEAEDLVMETAAQESRLTHLVQLGGGPGLGLWQMEPSTHDDHWKTFLRFKPVLAKRVLSATNTGVEIPVAHFVPSAKHLVYNLRYGAAMCRAHYRRKPGAIPLTREGRALYWKEHYNTPLGRGTTDEYLLNAKIVS